MCMMTLPSQKSIACSSRVILQQPGSNRVYDVLIHVEC
jgi:hypothetical protein